MPKTRVIGYYGDYHVEVSYKNWRGKESWYAIPRVFGALYDAEYVAAELAEGNVRAEFADAPRRQDRR